MEEDVGAVYAELLYQRSFAFMAASCHTLVIRYMNCTKVCQTVTSAQRNSCLADCSENEQFVQCLNSHAKAFNAHLKTSSPSKKELKKHCKTDFSNSKDFSTKFKGDRTACVKAIKEYWETEFPSKNYPFNAEAKVLLEMTDAELAERSSH
jgi:hypothetical protein